MSRLINNIFAPPHYAKSYFRMPLLALCFALVFCAAARTKASENSPRSRYFDKKISLDLWGKDLGKAINSISEQANIDIMISKHFIRPREYGSYKVYMKAEQIPVLLAIEWLCRSIDCHYRIDGPRSVYLTGSYDWIDNKDKKVLIESVDPITGPDDDLKELEAQFHELIKIHSLFSYYSIRIEQEDRQVVAILPEKLRVLLKDCLLAMSGPGKSPDASGSPPLNREETRLLKLLRAKVVANYQNQPLENIIADISLQSGVNIDFDSKPFIGKEIPLLSIDLGVVTLRKAVEEIAKHIGLKGYELSLPGGIYLTADEREWSTSASREYMWESLQVGSFNIAGYAAKFGGGGPVSHLVKSNVDRDVWLDPCTSVIFHQRSGNLIAIAPQETLDRIGAYLGKLSKGNGIN